MFEANKKGGPEMTIINRQKTLFNPGTVLLTRGVSCKQDREESFSKFIKDSLQRHITGDWGDLTEDDKALNDLSLDAEEPGRIFSMYKQGEEKIYIVTEWDRSATTVLFPEDY
jgi:hypothetical protein